ncbi:MAG: CPBP family intramembrane glutamic endopeptidase [Halanaeroarchaeum sp.]
MATHWVGFVLALTVITLGVLVMARSSADVLTTDEYVAIDGATLRANVVASQALVAVLVLGTARVAGVPWSAFGWRGIGGAGLGVVAGVALAIPNLALGRMLDDRTLRQAEAMRSLLAPETRRGWIVLVVVVVPVIAISEELLFRGALIGAAAIGLGVSPWVLAVPSSLAFGVAHQAQGTVGVVATAAFGFALAATFVATGDLLVVVVAHAVVDVAEFLLHEARS